MKKLVVSLTALILIAFIFVSCSDNSVTENSTVSVQKPSFSAAQTFCANNYFPLASHDPASFMTYSECGAPDINITSLKGAYLWSHYVADPDDQLLNKACGKTAGSVKSIDILIRGLNENNHPKLTWNFVYSHYYIVYKKIDNGAWVEYASIKNKGFSAAGEEYDYTSTNMAEFIDNNETINPDTYKNVNSNNLFYKVKAKCFTNKYSLEAPEVFYLGDLIVKMSGPTRVYMPLKGNTTTATWTASVTGGAPPYTYSWNQPGGSGATRTVTYTYAAGQPDHTVNLTCTVTDAMGTVKTAAYPYVEDYAPYYFEP